MSENKNPINRENRAQDEEFQNMLKEVFGQKEKIVNNRFKDSDSKPTVEKTVRPSSERPQTKRPVQRNNQDLKAGILPETADQ